MLSLSIYMKSEVIPWRSRCEVLRRTEVRWTMSLVDGQSSENKACCAIANASAGRKGVPMWGKQLLGAEGQGSCRHCLIEARGGVWEGWEWTQGLDLDCECKGTVESLQAPGLLGHCWPARFSPTAAVIASPAERDAGASPRPPPSTWERPL